MRLLVLGCQFLVNLYVVWADAKVGSMIGKGEKQEAAWDMPWTPALRQDWVLPVFDRDTGTVSGSRKLKYPQIFSCDEHPGWKSFLDRIRSDPRDMVNPLDQALVDRLLGLSKMYSLDDLFALYRTVTGPIVEDFYEKVYKPDGATSPIIVKDLHGPGTVEKIYPCLFGYATFVQLFYCLSGTITRSVISVILGNEEFPGLHDYVSSTPWAWNTLQALVHAMGLPDSEWVEIQHGPKRFMETYHISPNAEQLILRLPMRVRVDVYTWHVALALELGSLLALMFHNAEVTESGSTEIHFFGVYYPKSNLRDIQSHGIDETGRSGQLIELYRNLIDTYTDDYDRFIDPAYHLKMMNAMGEAYQALNDRPELYVCTTPILFCLVLAHTSAFPMMIYIDDLLDMIPTPAFEGLVHQLLQRLVTPGDVRVLASADFVSALTEFSWGGKFPSLTRLALYMPLYPHDGQNSKDALMLRTDYFVETNHGKLFIRLLYTFWSANPWINIRFHCLSYGSQMEVFGPSDEYTEFQPRMLFSDMPYATEADLHFDHIMEYTMQRMFAALFIPDDLAKSSFYEMYRMGIPLFVPGRQYLARLMMTMKYYHLLPRHELNTIQTSPEFMASPFNWFKGDMGFLQGYFWAGFLDMVNFEHLQIFGSIPELFYGLSTIDVQAVSIGMYMAHARRAEEAQKILAYALFRLLNLEPEP